MLQVIKAEEVRDGEPRWWVAGADRGGYWIGEIDRGAKSMHLRGRTAPRSGCSKISHAIVDRPSPTPPLASGLLMDEVTALRSKLAEAKRLGLEACAFVHGAIDNAPDPTSNDPGDQSAIAAGHSVADRIATSLEAL